MNLEINDIKQRIKDYIIKKYKTSENKIDEKMNLFEEGVVDSLGAFDLVAFIEQTFDVKFEEEHFFDQRFRSIDGMVAIIIEIKEATRDRAR